MKSLLCLTLALVFCNAEVVRHFNKIPDSYIIRYKNSMNSMRVTSLAQVLRSRSLAVQELSHVHSLTVKGSLSDSDIEILSNDPDVELIEEDGPVYAMSNARAGGCNSYQGSYLPWGLDYIDAPGNNNRYEVNDTVASTNDPVYVYVADTGIDETHPDFQGRVGNIYTAFSGGYEDGNGHGTHCAGTIGGYYFGVAKRCFLGNVRVLDDRGSGSYAGVINGINAAVANHRQRASNSGRGYAKSVLSMSLGGGKSTSVNSACNDASAAGVITVVAAGNSNADANNYSPASASDVICVGATDSSYNLASFSNWGSAVDIQAPGVSVKSAWSSKAFRRRRSVPTLEQRFYNAQNDNPSADLPPPSQSPDSMLTRTISGTSMACPHVAGVIANYLLGHEGAPPSYNSVKSWVTGLGKNGLINMGGRSSVNLFLQGKQC